MQAERCPSVEAKTFRVPQLLAEVAGSDNLRGSGSFSGDVSVVATRRAFSGILPRKGAAAVRPGQELAS